MCPGLRVRGRVMVVVADLALFIGFLPLRLASGMFFGMMKRGGEFIVVGVGIWRDLAAFVR